MTEPALDRALGALIGLAVGDALGAPVEFCSRGSFEPVTGMRSGGAFKLPDSIKAVFQGFKIDKFVHFVFYRALSLRTCHAPPRGNVPVDVELLGVKGGVALPEP